MHCDKIECPPHLSGILITIIKDNPAATAERVLLVGAGAAEGAAVLVDSAAVERVTAVLVAAAAAAERVTADLAVAGEGTAVLVAATAGDSTWPAAFAMSAFRMLANSRIMLSLTLQTAVSDKAHDEDGVAGTCLQAVIA